MSTAFRRRQRGLTLVEMATVIAITGVLVANAAPGFREAAQRHRLEGAAAVFETDVHLARSSAVSFGRTVRLDFQKSGDTSCYVLHAGPAGDCSCTGAQPVCGSGAVPQRVVRYPAGSALLLASNSSSMVFDPLAGTVTPTATVRFTAPDGSEVRQIVNVMGRVRSCSPTLAGYKAC